jgi:alcohol dehydrogenase class IV
MSKKAIALIFKNLPLAYKKPTDIEARGAMLEASLIAGFAFGNGGLGAVHGIGHPVGAVCKIPHGLVNAILLPYVVEFNSQGNRSMKELARKIRALNKKIGVPSRFSALYPKAGANMAAILKTMVYKSGSMAYNPVKMDVEKVKKILEKAL